jgi:methyl-accepting chemotaxis protein
MDEVTQQNAALVEQAAAAAESMEEQAGNLSQAVGIFRLVGNAASGGQRQVGQVERRETASRPKNVARLPKRDKSAITKPKAVGGTDEWSEF